jgi:hypothetical protein
MFEMIINALDETAALFSMEVSSQQEGYWLPEMKKVIFCL